MLKRKVAFIHRGLPKYRVSVYKTLQFRGNLNFHVFTQFFNGTSQQIGFSQPSEEELVGLNLTRVRSTRLNAILNRKLKITLPSLRVIVELIKYKPDIIVIEGMSNIGTIFFCLPYIYMNKIPFIWWSLGQIVNKKKTIRSYFGKIIQAWFVKNSSAVFSYSTYGKDYFVSLGAESHKVHVLYNTLDEESIIKQAKECQSYIPEIRKRLRLEAQPTIVFSGTIRKEKNLHTLITAFSKVKKSLEHKNPQLIVIGDGVELANNKKLASKLGLSNSIHFVGRQEERASAYFLLGDFVVMPGTGGLAINHAFAHKLPVICGPADGCEIDLVKNKDTGIYLNEITCDTLTNAIISLINDSDSTEKMGENAYRLVTTKITLEKFCTRIETGIIKILNSIQ